MTLINFQDKSIWRSLYEKSKEQYWQPEAIDCVSDKNSWHKLDPRLKAKVLNLLQYAILLDSFQVGNLAEISGQQSDPMLKALMSFHGLMEAVHSQSYSYWAETVCTPAEKEFLYTETETSRARLQIFHGLEEGYGSLIANYFLEGVAFQALFRLSDSLKSQGLLPGLSAILNLIRRDEDTHVVTFQHLIKESPGAMVTIAEAFDSAIEQEKTLIYNVTQDDDLAQSVYNAADLRIKALGIKADVRLDPFAAVRDINDTSKQKLKQNFFTSNVIYSQRDEALDWEYKNWF
jgi:ribonucleotide reductase beta subunit family protein with ferritin-like domain